MYASLLQQNHTTESLTFKASFQLQSSTCGKPYQGKLGTALPCVSLPILLQQIYKKTPKQNTLEIILSIIS